MPFTSIRRECARRCDEYRCSYCPNETFHNSCSLVKHLRKSWAHKSKDNQTFECTICNNTFVSRTGYIHHLQQKRIHKYDLHQAACCGRYQDVSKLIYSEYANVAGASHRVNSDTQLIYQLGATPMHCAAFKGYSRCLRIMVAWQDPNVVDEYGQTPVHVAARCGRATSLKLLLSKGGRLSEKDKNNQTPISLAAGHCMDVVVEYQMQRLLLKYYKPEITVKRYLSIDESEDIEEHGDVSDGELSTTNTEETKTNREESNTVKRSLSFLQGDHSEVHEQQIESEHGVPTEDTNTDRTVALCSRALLEETIGNDEHVADHNGSMLEDGSSSSTSEVSSELVPYEIIARGKKAIHAFKTALSQGTAPASRLKLIVVGEVGAGKTSLTRSLSQQPFIETRKKTHGIETLTVSEPLVENTELDVSWKLADPGDASHLDEILAEIVSSNLTELEENNVDSPRSNLAVLSLVKSDENQIFHDVCTSASMRPVSPTPEARILAHPSIAVEGTPRKLPATLIAKKLLQKKKEGLSFKVSIWDFAGHQLYETMHHVFMNSRSLYLAVFSLVKMAKSREKCLARIHYWLNSIASHTSRSTPIILVGTNKAKVDSNFVEETNQLIEQHFGYTFGPRLIRNHGDKILFAVENEDGQDDEGVSSLIKVIKSEASSSLPFVAEEFPLKWLHCEEEIVAYQQVAGNKKFMTFDEVKELLTRKCNVTFTEEEFRSMLAFFHDSGVILLPDVMCEGESSQSLRGIVVLSPQYLVDVMTRLHDIRGDRQLKRQFSDEFKKLKDEGRADCRLLDHLWKDLEKNELLLELLTHFNLLYPLHNEIEDDLKQDNATALDATSSSVENSSRQEFIIPCMLKEKSSESIERHWNGICEKWKDISVHEHVLVFDFGRFLPPALFDYLVVHIYRHSHKTKGMQPILKRRNGIFSFSNKFLFRMELLLKDSQILVYARCKPGEYFLNLASKLRENVSQICQKYFKFLKFISGPPCPRSDCPGASFNAEVVQRPCDSSSSESQDSSDDNEGGVEEKETKGLTSCTGDYICRRRHVIPMIPYSFDPPYWCQQVEIEEHALEDWNPTNITAEDLCESFDDTETTDGLVEPGCTEECCVAFTAPYLGKDWKEVARKLGAEESELENIDIDFTKQEDQGFQALLSWQKRMGNDAGIVMLQEALQKSGRKDISDKLEKHHQEVHH